MLNIRERFLNFIATQATEHPIRLLLVIGLFTAGCLILASGVKLDLSMLAELPENDPMVERFKEAYDNYGGLEYVFVVLESKDIDRAKKMADEMAPALKGLKKYFRSVRHKVDVDFFKPYSILFLSLDEIKDLTSTFRRNLDTYKTMLKKLDVETFLLGTYSIFDREISEINEITEEDTRASGIKGLRRWSERVRQILVEGKKVKPSTYRNTLAGIFAARAGTGGVVDEYFLSPNEKLLTIMLAPVEPSENIVYDIEAMKALENVVNRFRPRYPDVKVGITGAVAIVRDQHIAIQKDMKMTTIISMIGVLVLFAVSYGRLIYAFLMGIPLAIGLIWTLAFVRIYPGAITITTSVFGAILIGLGIDFAIHLVSRFNDDIYDGKDVPTAVRNAVTATGKGIITGAVTTATAFFTLLMAYHKGVEFLGAVAGTGVLLCMLAMFLVVPPILLVLGRRGILGRGSQLGPLVRMARVMERKPLYFFIPVAILTGWMVFEAEHVAFDNNFRNLMPQDMPSLQWVKHFEEEFERGIDYGLVVVDTVEEARRQTEMIEELDTVGFVDSIANYLPDAQEEKIDALKPLAEMLDSLKPASPDSVIFDGPDWRRRWKVAFSKMRDIALALKQLCVAGGYFEGEDDATRFRDNLDTIIKALEEGKVSEENARYFNSLHAREFVQSFYDFRKSARPSVLTVNELPEDIKKAYIGTNGKYLIYAYPSQSVWTDKAFMGRFVEDMKSVNPDAFGIPFIFYYASARILEDLERSAVLALLVIFLLVYLDFRSIKYTVLVLIPLLMGAVWMVGSMPFLGVYFNFINVGTVSLVLGIGIDDGVHMMHRFLGEREHRVVHTIARTGRAIILTSLTTMIGFGALLLAHFRGLNTMGEVLLMGVGYCLLTSIFGLGSILGLLSRSRS